LILEVEEIYQDVKKYTNRECKAEYEIIEAADAYIFSTRLLSDTLNKYNKPYTISSGNYLSEPRIVEQLHDGITHVVYAGTFDPEKGGAIAAIKAALYLTRRFHVHILGFGSRKDVENVIELIKQVNAQSEACVSYEGALTGKPFIEFLQRCHIGLSTQNPTGQYNDTSFPSKILTYLSNGLKVVSVAIPVVAKSPLAKSLFLYNSSNPQAIAEAVLEAEKTSNKDSAALLCELDRDFLKSISELV